MPKKQTKKAAKAAPKKTSKTTTKPAAKPSPKAFALTDAALDRLMLAVMNVVDYDIAKGVFGPNPEDPEEAEATKAEVRGVIRKHLGG
jgi:hypothetical protein